MDINDILNRIREIVFSVPDEVYKFMPPVDCFEGEWEEASLQEKAFLLIEDLLLQSNKEKIEEKRKDKPEVDMEIIIDNVPRFYNNADENMFFNALYTVPSIIEVKGNYRGLILECSKQLSKEERDFLIGLFNRYGVEIPEEMK